MSRISLLLGAGAGLLLGLLVNACTNDDSGETTVGACDSIMEACHPKDDGTDETISGCHEVAHEGDDAACTTQLQSCVDYCNAAPDVGTSGHESGETGHDDHASESGETADHGHDSSGGSGSTGHHGSTGHDSGSTGGSTGADDSSQASCEELGSTCHDTADEMGMMCHDIGHEGDEVACAEVWVECIAHCTAG